MTLATNYLPSYTYESNKGNFWMSKEAASRILHTALNNSQKNFGVEFNGHPMRLNKHVIITILDSSLLFKISVCNNTIVVKTDTSLPSTPYSQSRTPSILSNASTRPSSSENQSECEQEQNKTP